MKGLDENTKVMSKLVDAFGEIELTQRDMSKDFERLNTGMIRANDDIIKIKEALSIDGDSKKDFNYLRRLRESNDERRPVVVGVMIAVCAAVVIGAAGWIGAAMFSKAATEITKTGQVK